MTRFFVIAASSLLLFGQIVFGQTDRAEAQRVMYQDESGNLHWVDSTKQVPYRYRKNKHQKRQVVDEKALRLMQETKLRREREKARKEELRLRELEIRERQRKRELEERKIKQKEKLQ